MPTTIRTLCVMTLCLLSAACSSKSDLPPLIEVTGQVIQDGQPLADAVVEFYPTSGKRSVAFTDEEGKFELLYDKDVKGAVAGSHTVNFMVPPKTVKKIDPKFNDYEKKQAEQRYGEPAPIKYEEHVVVDKDHTTFTFDLTKKK
jgi:hypothetical protein